MLSETSSEEFFDAKYRLDSDPWKFSTDAYEQSRYSATIDALEGRKYEYAFEPGCSIGVLTQKLAGFCRQVRAIDISQTAVLRAQARCKHLPNVEVSHGRLPQAIPSDPIDLIVFSEIGYYFQAAELSLVVRDLISHLTLGGTLLAVHWLGNSADHQLTGDQVHGIIETMPGLHNRLSRRYDGFRLDLWTKE